MSILKCKMCGAPLNIEGNATVAICEYCGTKQTIPKLDDDRRANLYDRASHFRRNNEFDKAAGIYEQILAEDSTDAEAYWSLVLCRYGIEYVEDPETRKRIPTVNRTQMTSVYADENYKSAVRYADQMQRPVYEEEARTIDEIQKGILKISSQEEPFDIFICYKETDDRGRRTRDSVLANELYYQLKQEGYKAFFSRITLEDKLGSAYEPYIFAALNSAKVMVVLGTKPEYFNAVWVKNEWSRYLALIKAGKKKTLIPAYRDMDPYDLPEEFAYLQALDMSKLGFMQDLIRGIHKIIGGGKTSGKTDLSTAGANSATAPLVRRMMLFLEVGDWESAQEYSERILDQEPENAMAYVGKMMAELKVQKPEMLANLTMPFSSNRNYGFAMRFADSKLKTELQGYLKTINDRNEEQKRQQELEARYSYAVRAKESASTSLHLSTAATYFDQLGDYKDSVSQARWCREEASRLTQLANRQRQEELRQKQENKEVSGRELENKSTVQKEEEKPHFIEGDIESSGGKKKKGALVFLTALVALIAVVFVIIPNTKNPNNNKGTDEGERLPSVSTSAPTKGTDSQLAGTYDIKIWCPDASVGLTREQIANFNKTNSEGIIINAAFEAISEGDAAASMITDVEAGSDLFFFAQDQTARLIEAGALAKLGKAAAANVQDNNDPAAVKAVQCGTELYGYPLTVNFGYFMYYDKSVIPEEDLGSMEKLLEDCEKAGKYFSFDVKNGWYVAAFFFATGCSSEWEYDDNGKAIACRDNWNSANGLIAAKAIKTFVSSKAYNNSSSGADFAAATPSAIVVSGTWDYNTVKDILGDNLGAAELPSFTVDGKSYHLGSFNGCKLLGVKPQTDAVKQAVLHRVAQYLTNEECEVARFEALGWGPSNLAALANEKVSSPALIALSTLSLRVRSAAAGGILRRPSRPTLKKPPTKPVCRKPLISTRKLLPASSTCPLTKPLLGL